MILNCFKGYQLVHNSQNEFCGHFNIKGRNLEQIIDNEGESILNPFTHGATLCPRTPSMKNLTWHTHPADFTGPLPSANDILMLTHPNITLEILFTQWGVWEMYGKGGYVLSDKEVKNINKFLGKSNVHPYIFYKDEYVKPKLHELIVAPLLSIIMDFKPLSISEELYYPIIDGIDSEDEEQYQEIFGAMDREMSEEELEVSEEMLKLPDTVNRRLYVHPLDENMMGNVKMFINEVKKIIKYDMNFDIQIYFTPWNDIISNNFNYHLMTS